MIGRNTLTAYEDLAAKRLFLSSEMLSFTPLSRGKEMYALLPFPMMKILFNLCRGENWIVRLDLSDSSEYWSKNIVISLGNAEQVILQTEQRP